MTYRDSLLVEAEIELLVVGNMNERQILTLASALKQRLKQWSQTLEEEASRFADDFDHSNFAFDTCQKSIVQIMQLTAATLSGYFYQAVIRLEERLLLLQLSGSGQDKSNYAEPKGWFTSPNASPLQKVLPGKIATP